MSDDAARHQGSRPEMTPQRWRDTGRYLREVFGRQDPHLEGLMREAAKQGLPDIAVSADVGRLLFILTSMTRGMLAIEAGTLAGYSAIWIARGLAPGGRLVTIECDPEHAAFARQQFERAGVAGRIELREGRALHVLERLARELSPGTVDVVFLDADKSEYPRYLAAVRDLIAPGGLLLADNCCGSGYWWIDQAGHPARDSIDRFNRLVAADPAFEAVVVPLRQGLLIARKKGRAEAPEAARP
jgi:predicted O-methyltransferase YrrM